jgi:hypothetical protein
VLLACASTAPGQLRFAADAGADVTEDGLHRVDASFVRDAWARPGVDLSTYRAIYIMPTGVSFRPVESLNKGDSARDVADDFPLDDATRMRIRAYFREAFVDAVAQSREFPVSDSVARDVLVAQGFLVDVVAHLPLEDDGMVSTMNFARYPWEATIVLELRDSMSGTVIARTINRERVTGTPDAGIITWYQTQRALDAWSLLLQRRLDELARASRATR